MSSLTKTEQARKQDRPIHLKVLPQEAKQRLDRFIAGRLPELSRSYIQKIIESGGVQIKGQLARASTKIDTGEVIDLLLPSRPTSELKPQSIPLNILYEDDDLLVLNKPAGLVVHPAAGHADGTLVNALLHHDPRIAEVGGVDRPGIVHRLDKGTSGVMVIAKSEPARLDLMRQFKRRTIYKEYWALVHGVLTPTEGVIESALGRHPKHRQKFAVKPSGKMAKTEYVVQNQYGGHFCDVRLIIHTGRTHQIRVHLSNAGHPIVGDKMYGGKRDTKKTLPAEIREVIRSMNRPALHAAVLGFKHPVSGEEVRFEAPLPGDLKRLINYLKEL